MYFWEIALKSGGNSAGFRDSTVLCRLIPVIPLLPQMEANSKRFSEVDSLFFCDVIEVFRYKQKLQPSKFFHLSKGKKLRERERVCVV